ncbi:glycoside hydrolase family protein [Micromonospora sp. NPDC000207]|uniref:glycoside hydrolase family protein n=1 Tax=Micromonospora sp. NPDC000207 TaxID=3154246 RepID=UPI00331C4DD6
MKNSLVNRPGGRLALTAFAVASVLLGSGLLATARVSPPAPTQTALGAAPPIEVLDGPGVVLTPGVAGSPSVSPSASPTPTPSTVPSPSPTRVAAAPEAVESSRAPRRTAPAPQAAVTSAKKGVGAWRFDGVSQALEASTASWYYTWSTRREGIDTPRGVQFVPMIWGPGSVTDQALAEARAAGPYLLGFNEPDLAEQSNMSVEEALRLWPRLMSTGSRLGSPAVAYGGADPGGWLDRFMSGAKERGYRVDFIALHWYGGDFDSERAVGQLQRYLADVYARYRLPIWLTEFALMDFSGGAVRFPTQQQQAAFLTGATKMLGNTSYVHRYAWFGLPATDRDRTGLFRSGTEATVVGRAFQAAG